MLKWLILDSTNGDVFSDYIRTAPKNSRSVWPFRWARWLWVPRPPARSCALLQVTVVYPLWGECCGANIHLPPRPWRFTSYWKVERAHFQYGRKDHGRQGPQLFQTDDVTENRTRDLKATKHAVLHSLNLDTAQPRLSLLYNTTQPSHAFWSTLEVTARL